MGRASGVAGDAFVQAGGNRTDTTRKTMRVEVIRFALFIGSSFLVNHEVMPQGLCALRRLLINRGTAKTL